MGRLLLTGLLFCLALTTAGAATTETFPLRWDPDDRPGAAPKSVVETTAGLVLAAQTEHSTAGVLLRCQRSLDGGETWSPGGVIASDRDRRTDLGDTAMLVLRNGDVLAAYRHNHYRRRSTEERSFVIRVARSRDGGLSWTPHSTVDSTTGTTAGLWASFLFETSQGELQCYYDDEAMPAREGFPRHQWLTLRNWMPEKGEWSERITVSRAQNPGHLSRDGMCTIVETAPGKLLCVFESVDVERPHKGVLRRVTSSDYGRTWSWAAEDRPIVWRPKDHLYNALAPWTIQLLSGTLLCVFVTDEDRGAPDTPSTGRLDEDVKAVYSDDGGMTWSARPQTISASHPCYLPGVVELKAGPRRGQVLVLYTSWGVAKVKFGYGAGADSSGR